MNTEFQKLKRRKETERKLQGNYIQFWLILSFQNQFAPSLSDAN